MKYLDVHTHVFPDSVAVKVIRALEDFYGYEWKCKGTVSDLISTMDHAGVQRSIIFSSATKPEQVRTINAYISSIVKEHPERFIGFGTLHPAFDDWKNEIARMKKLGLLGMKFHPDFQKLYIDEDAMMNYYAETGDTMPFLFHVGDKRTDYSSPKRLAHVLDTFPGIRVIAAHLGGYSEWDQAKKYLIGRKDVYLDVSSTLPQLSREEMKEMILAHGIDRILFASDYPAVTAEQAVKDVLSLGFSPEENEKIFHLNAEKFLRLDEGKSENGI